MLAPEEVDVTPVQAIVDVFLAGFGALVRLRFFLDVFSGGL